MEKNTWHPTCHSTKIQRINSARWAKWISLLLCTS